MYATLLVLHSIWRWAVVISLAYAIIKALKGLVSKSSFSLWDNKVRHWTATIAHIQLVLGVLIFVKSPIIKVYFNDFKTLVSQWEFSFYGLLHPLFMLSAIVCVTLGSAKAKRYSSNEQKYKTMFLWFSVALVLIFIAIPWPFSPMSNKPLIRTF